MEEIQISSRQLPDKLEDLAKFALIGREKLNAVRAGIRAIKEVGFAKEVYEQKLIEAQEIGEAVLDAEVKIGELTKDMEKSVGGRPSETTDSGVHSLPTKASQLEKIGISEKQKQRYETLANHPEAVKKAKTDARKEGKIVTRQDVLNRIAPTSMHSASYLAKQDEREAIKRHDKFSEKVNTESVIDLSELQQDKQDKIVAISNTKRELIDTLNRMSSLLTVIPEPKIKEMFGAISDQEISEIKEKLYMAQRISTKLLRYTEDI